MIIVYRIINDSSRIIFFKEQVLQELFSMVVKLPLNNYGKLRIVYRINV